MKTFLISLLFVGCGLDETPPSSDPVQINVGVLNEAPSWCGVNGHRVTCELGAGADFCREVCEDPGHPYTSVCYQDDPHDAPSCAWQPHEIGCAPQTDPNTPPRCGF